MLDPEDTGWANLGAWRSRTTYPEAARALASWVGDHAELTKTARVADLGCGEGASLLWWRDAYGVTESFGFEPDPAAAQRALGRVSHGTIVSKPAAAVCDLRDLDAVVAVDAAYHFDHDLLFDAVARSLRRGGLFAATDFVRSSGGGRWRAIGVRAGARLFGFGASVPLARDHLELRLARAGLELTAYEDLSNAVLIGFADHVDTLETEGRMSGRGAMKLRITAAAARRVCAHDLVRYVGFAARRIR